MVGEYTNWYQRDGAGLKICRSKLVVNYSGGNLALLERAMQRAAAQAGA